MSEYDSPWKEVLDAYFEAFLAFFFPEVHAGIDWSRGYVPLDKELRQVVREAEIGPRVVDKLVKVWLRNGEEKWVLIHVEIQSQQEGDFPRRMFVYNYRLFDRYNRQVVSLAVLGDERPTWRPDRFGYELWGCRVLIEFPTVKLLDYAEDWEALEGSDNPFATVVMAHLRAQQTRADIASRHSWKLLLIRGLYERGMSRRDIRQLFRFIDWVIDLPEDLENEFWQEVITLEEEKKMPFMTTGERIGFKKGMDEGLLRGIEVALRLKFGEEGEAILPDIRQVKSVETLQAILEAIETAEQVDVLRRLMNGSGQATSP